MLLHRIVLLCVLAAAELQSVQRYFAARRARPDAAPLHSAYRYSQVNNEPATIQTFHSLHAGTEDEGRGVKNATHSEANQLNQNSTESSKQIKRNKMPSKGLPTMMSKNSISFREHKLWPNTDATGKLKLAASSVLKSYGSVFRADDEDIRTGFKNSYDIWPFFYQNLRGYVPKKLDLNVEKVKDKRSAIPKLEKVIPVHEKVDETADDRRSENKVDSPQHHKHTNAGTTDNPIYGNQSYVINDYFDKTDANDPTTFKGHSWGKEFDQEMALQDIDDYSKRMRRLQENTPKVSKKENEKKTNTLTEHDATRESLNSKGRDLYRESESREKGDDREHSYEGRHRYDGENYRGFKDFADSFAHMFGSEDHDRETNYAKKNNANKGEKKKGFRTIHHKDEYQEHHDFFDDTDNSENAEEKGSSKVHIGGSEALLRSSAGAATGSDANTLRNTENIERNEFERNHEDKQRYNGIERELDRHRDVAKHTALSDDADYVDRYML